MKLDRIFAIAAALTLSACGQSNSGQIDTADLQASCEALVAAETGAAANDVTALSTQTVPGGTTTSVNVAGADAPWLCRADPGGVILGVAYSQQG